MLDNETRHPMALYVTTALGSAALGAFVYAVAATLTGSLSVASALLGITIAIGVFPILADRARRRGTQLSFWKWTASFVALGALAGYISHVLRLQLG